MITKPNIANGILPLKAFVRDSRSVLKKLKRSQEPVVLTVDGKAEVVMIDPAAFEAMIDQLETVQSVRESVTSFSQGEGRPAKEALADIRQRLA